MILTIHDFVDFPGFQAFGREDMPLSVRTHLRTKIPLSVRTHLRTKTHRIEAIEFANQKMIRESGDKQFIFIELVKLQSRLFVSNLQWWRPSTNYFVLIFSRFF